MLLYHVPVLRGLFYQSFKNTSSLLSFEIKVNLVQVFIDRLRNQLGVEEVETSEDIHFFRF